MTNTGKEYEALTEMVFKRLLDQSHVCSEVQRNVTIKGKSSGVTHQIDVAFEFSIGKIRYRTIVQCKDWGRPVEQEKVLAFNAVLQDIPGQPRGIMVARSGFQEGAREYARSHGISLYELREHCDSDWDGYIREVQVTLNLHCPRFRDVRLEPDLDWLRDQMPRCNLREFSVNRTFNPREVELRCESGEVFDVNALLNRHVPNDACDWTPIRRDFETRVMVPLEDGPLPHLAVVAVTAEVLVQLVSDTFTVRLDGMIAYCFRDVIGGSLQFLDPLGRPLAR